MKKEVVVLGGGTGLSAILRGFKKIDNINISAVVTVVDSGGSTGELRKHFDIPAVGDLRRVIASMSTEREELERNMEFRFSDKKSPFFGHTLGNLIIAGLIEKEGSFSKGVAATSKMLNVRGNVIPVSNDHHHLYAELKSGKIVITEDEIGHTTGEEISRVFYKSGKATKVAVDSILNADVIVLGIGSLFTSLLPNLIYPEIRKALKITKAKIIYIANIFTQHGETDDMTLAGHIKAIEKHTHKNVIDRVIVSSTELSDQVIKSYKEDKQFMLEIDLPKSDYEEYDLVSVNKDIVRHDEMKLKNVFEKIFNGEA